MSIGCDDVYAAWQRTTSLGWTVTLGAPVSTVDVPLRRSRWRLALGGLLAILTAGTLAIALGRRISGAIGEAQVSRDRPRTWPARPSSAIEEVDAVGLALGFAR